MTTDAPASCPPIGGSHHRLPERVVRQLAQRAKGYAENKANEVEVHDLLHVAVAEILGTEDPRLDDQPALATVVGYRAMSRYLTRTTREADRAVGWWSSRYTATHTYDGDECRMDYVDRAVEDPAGGDTEYAADRLHRELSEAIGTLQAALVLQLYRPCPQVQAVAELRGARKPTPRDVGAALGVSPRAVAQARALAWSYLNGPRMHEEVRA